jgi:hypothetical protein
MSRIENDHQAMELGRAWDRLIAGEQVDRAEVEPTLVSTILLVDQLGRTPPMRAQLEEAIWSNVIAGTGELWRPETSPANEQLRSGFLDQLAPIMRLAGIIATGMIGGFIAGIGSRIFMRFSGLLTIDRNRFRLTENEARVGEITFGGTMFLGLVGAALGVVALLIYLALRNRLPFDGWRRSGAYAVLLLLVFGYVVMDPSNPDYQLFGPTWLNVSMYSSLYLLMGFCCAQAYELSRGIGTRLDIANRQVAVRAALAVISIPLCAFGILVTFSALFIGASGLIVVALAAIAWLVDRYLVQGRFSFTWMPVAVRQWGLLVVPGIVGFVLTARGITEILVNR